MQLTDGADAGGQGGDEDDSDDGEGGEGGGGRGRKAAGPWKMPATQENNENDSDEEEEPQPGKITEQCTKYIHSSESLHSLTLESCYYFCSIK
jgi:hypothetical protein